MADISEPVGFAKSIARDLEPFGVDLVGVYLHGSACLGGWNAATSDVDLLIVVEDSIEPGTLEVICRVVIEQARHCPGTGIECSIVTRSQAGVIRDRWPYLAHINTPDNVIPDIFPAPEHNDPDLLMHYAVCHESGIVISGPDACEVFAPVPRGAVLAYLAEELMWGLDHGSGAYALLNGCRARIYLEQNRIVSKILGGSLALEMSDAPIAEVRAAIAAQRNESPQVPIEEGGISFVHLVAQELRDANTGQSSTIRSI